MSGILFKLTTRCKPTRCIPKLYNIQGLFASSNPQMTESSMLAILKKRFPNAKDIQVKDTSGGCGQMFSVMIDSEDFKNMSVLKQHKMVYETLNDQIKAMHGLHLVTKSSSSK